MIKKLSLTVMTLTSESIAIFCVLLIVIGVVNI